MNIKNKMMNKNMMQKHTSKMEANASIGIIGCGWLGKALAISLLKNDMSVLATSSNLANVDKLNQQGIDAQQLTLPIDNTELVQHDVFTQQCIIIAITPKFKQGRTDYAEKIAQLVSAAQQGGLVEHIILLSSTAVYHGLVGNVDEDSQLSLTTEKVQMLNAAEQHVLNFSKLSSKLFSKQGSVLRLAGLVGPERHPGKFLTLSNSTAPINLIHQQDAVGLIESLIKAQSEQEVFNGVSDTHVSKQEYYQAAAQALSLKAPIFAQKHLNDISRIVSGEKAKQVLNYKFIYPNLLTWL